MERYITGYQNGQPIYGEDLSIEETLAKIKASSEYKNFAAKFDLANEGNKTLLGMLIDEKLGPDPSVEDYKQLLRIGISVGGMVTLDGTTYEFELKQGEPAPELEPELPAVDARGHILGASQKAWSEYRQFAEKHSSQECRDRAKVDRGFASFVRLNLQREAQETPSTQFSIAGHAATENKPAITPELIAFAEEFRRTPMDRVRALKSPATNPLGYEIYERHLQAAIAANLIGR